MAKAVLINEELRRAGEGGMRAKEIIRMFREGRHGKDRR